MSDTRAFALSKFRYEPRFSCVPLIAVGNALIFGRVVQGKGHDATSTCRNADTNLKGESR